MLRFCRTRVLVAITFALVLLLIPAAPSGASPRCLRVAIVGVSTNTGYNADIQAKLQETGRFAAVDVISANEVLPTFDQLLAYDSVLVYTDGGASQLDLDALGDVLADYSDAGGGVVLATFSFSADLAVTGRISTEPYTVLSHGPQTQDIPMQLVPDIADHPLLRGVDSFNGGASSYHSAPVLVAEGVTLVAHWSGDLQPLVAVRDAPVGNSRIVALNFYPVSSDVYESFWDATTDGAVLMANALTHSSGARVPTTRADCMHGGWRDLVDDQGRQFRNQGDCVRFVLRHR
jgi:hypothetical protein